MTGTAPEVACSTREERLAYVRERYRCIADCDNCGICAMFHNVDPEVVFEDYIEGIADLVTCAQRARS